MTTGQPVVTAVTEKQVGALVAADRVVPAASADHVWSVATLDYVIVPGSEGDVGPFLNTDVWIVTDTVLWTVIC